MRHKRRGRVLGRSPSHRKAMLKNLASALFLTERETDEELDSNIPKVKGRITTTLHKAKEVRPLVEKCITIAKRSLLHSQEAEQYGTSAERGSEDWRQWRGSEEWRQWCDAISPAVAARRRVQQMLGDKEAVSVLFDEIAPRFEDRDGGYTRVLRLAKPRLGDGGQRAILELVGAHDRVKAKSEKPAFAADEQSEDLADQEQVTAEDSAAEPSEAADEQSDAAPGEDGGEVEKQD